MKRRIEFLLLLSIALVPAQAAQAQQMDPTRQAEPAWLLHPEMHANWTAWRETMKQTKFPRETGCFTASYPYTTWNEASCIPAPAKHYSAPARSDQPNTVGNTSGDYTAVVSGQLTSVVGSFPIVSGYVPPPLTNYSLQVNSNLFATSSCSGALNPSACHGWVQFVFDNDASALLLEYSLINWGSTNCPSGYGSYAVGGEDICYKNTPVVGVPEQPYANLPYLELTAQVSGTTNTAILATADGNIYATANPGLFGTDLAQNWNTAEFNVFGNGGGDQVNFNSGATFVVQTRVNSGTTTVPYCPNISYTGETNNLSLVGACCPYGGASPNIQFMESNNSVAQSSCGTSGLQGNITAPPPTDSGTYTISGGPPDPTITFTMILSDSNPNAEIYWTVPGCAGTLNGSSPVASGVGFTLVYNPEYNCNPSGTMYAVVPGFLPSQTQPINFP